MRRLSGGATARSERARERTPNDGLREEAVRGACSSATTGSHRTSSEKWLDADFPARPKKQTHARGSRRAATGHASILTWVWFERQVPTRPRFSGDDAVQTGANEAETARPDLAKLQAPVLSNYRTTEGGSPCSCAKRK